MTDQNQNDILDQEFFDTQQRRRSLLPIWIKIFIWIFFLPAVLVPVGLIFGALGHNFELSLYGLESHQPFSIIGILVSMLFLLKGGVSFGLWMEQDWGVTAARIDAIIGIIICSGLMIVLPLLAPSGEVEFTIRFELLVLIPYYLKMTRIKAKWDSIEA